MAVATLDRDVDVFAKIVANLDDTTDLARPALILAADEYPGLNIRRYLNKLDDLADEALQSVVVGAKDDCEAARRLARFLFDTHGFQGNEQAFYDPANSFLNEVLDHRAGIPISLSLVLIEVGRRLGVPLVGIGFPGHFLVGCGPHRRNEYLLLDPYCQGKIVDWSECEQRLQAMGMEFDPEEHLSPVSNRQFFERILNNLKAIYIRRRDTKRSLRTIGRLTMLNGDFALDYRALANLLATEGVYDEARVCLRTYLDLELECEETNAVRQFLEQLMERRALRN